jgi:hypothetical protein
MVHVNVAAPLDPAWTVIVNGGKEAVPVPSLTEMVMFE